MNDTLLLKKRRNLGSIGFLAVCICALLTACATSGSGGYKPEATQAHTEVAVPHTTPLAYEKVAEHPGAFRFEGQIALRGLLLAYWEATYTEAEPVSLADADPMRTLALRFYPDAESVKHLPRFEEGGLVETKIERIFLYRDVEPGSGLDHFITEYSPGEQRAIRDITQHFEMISNSFLEHEEGYALQPVRVVLSGIVSFIEGNSRLTFAQPLHIEGQSFSDYALGQIPDAQEDAFLGRPWVESFFTAHDAKLRAEPSDDAKTIAHIASGAAYIEKIHTEDDTWVRVRVVMEQVQPQEGYMRASELMVIN